MKRLVFTLAVVMFLISSWHAATPANAVTSRTPGVQAGDWAKYSVAFNYSTNDPNPPMFKPPLEGIEYYKMEVTSVVDTNITYNTVIHYQNGTEMNILGWIDVSSGETNYGSTGFGILIAANLTAGDKIYLNPLSATINATGTGTYAGNQREVNCLYITQNFTYPYSPERTQLVEYDVCWDKTSGIFVSMNENITFIDTEKGYTTCMTISLVITETNVWKPIPAVAVGVFIFPRVINLKSNGKWILAIIELPKGYEARNVNISTVMINGTIPVEGKALVIGKRWLLIKFDREKAISFILSKTDSEFRFMIATLTITGKLSDGSIFQGSDRIIAFLPPSRYCRAHPV